MRINVRQRKNGLVAHCAAFPLGIKDRRMAEFGKYHGNPVCEHADGSFYELAQTVPNSSYLQVRQAKGVSRQSVPPHRRHQGFEEPHG
jgi:hypothetical protein